MYAQVKSHNIVAQIRTDSMDRSSQPAVPNRLKKISAGYVIGFVLYLSNKDKS
jgi:hypothetical protein